MRVIDTIFNFITKEIVYFVGFSWKLGKSKGIDILFNINFIYTNMSRKDIHVTSKLL